MTFKKFCAIRLKHIKVHSRSEMRRTLNKDNTVVNYAITKTNKIWFDLNRI